MVSARPFYQHSICEHACVYNFYFLFRSVVFVLFHMIPARLFLYMRSHLVQLMSHRLLMAFTAEITMLYRNYSVGVSVD